MERSAETTRDDPDGEYLKRNRWLNPSDVRPIDEADLRKAARGVSEGGPDDPAPIGFTFAEGGCGNAANGPNIFWNQGLSGADIGAQPRTARDVVRRVFRHLHPNVPVPGRFALDHAANVGARRRISRPHFHHPA